MATKVMSNYRGSVTTAQLVQEEIRKRWGDKEANAYDPYTNCLTYRQWQEMNYQVKRGEKAILSFTFIDVVDELGKVLHSYRKTVHLFYRTQVEPCAQNQG